VIDSVEPKPNRIKPFICRKRKWKMHLLG
jgi:hypothetical protein